MGGDFKWAEAFYDEFIGEWCWRSNEYKQSPLEFSQTFNFGRDEQDSTAILNKRSIDGSMKDGHSPYTCWYQRYNNKTPFTPRLLDDFDLEFEGDEYFNFNTESCDLHRYWDKPQQEL
jgi:hypothetical protein